MDKVPEYNQLNPAFQPKCNFFLGIADIYANAGNNSLSLKDILIPYRNDTLITFLHDSAKTHNFIQNLKEINNIYYNLQVSPLNIGVRIKGIFFTLGVSVKSDMAISYPRDFIKLMSTLQLNTTTSYNFKNFGINTSNYAEVSLGVSKNINDNITFGVRAKALSGIFNVTTQNNKFTFGSSVVDSMYRQNVSADLNVYATMPYFNVETDSAGKLKSITSRSGNPYKYYKPFNNPGVGFDFGVTYSGIDKFMFSASLLDIGFIRWRSETYKFSFKGDTSFMGVGNIDLLNNSDSNKFTSQLVDSFKHVFKFSQTKTKYTTWLPAKLILGAEFIPAQFFSLGLLSVTQYYRNQFYQQFTLSGNLRLFRMFMLSTSYSILDNGFSNMGVGLSFRVTDPIIYLIPINFYFIFDNIPLYYAKKDYIPYKAENFDFRFGINFVFGAGAQQKKRTDKPLIVD